MELTLSMTLRKLEQINFYIDFAEDDIDSKYVKTNKVNWIKVTATAALQTKGTVTKTATGDARNDGKFYCIYRSII